MATERVIDWEAIEREYRAGIRSLRDIADQYGVVESAIRKRAGRDGWTRDLSARIKLKAADLVRKEQVRKEVRKENMRTTERETVEVAATLQAQVIFLEREEIQCLTCRADELEIRLKNSDEDLKTQATVTKQVVEIREKIINMRRRNYGINDNSNGDADRQPQHDEARTTDYLTQILELINAAP